MLSNKVDVGNLVAENEIPVSSSNIPFDGA